ncbi:hypothetical protein ACIBF5_09415 [Micromonospora sp. NPDC050417]
MTEITPAEPPPRPVPTPNQHPAMPTVPMELLRIMRNAGVTRWTRRRR